MPTIRWIVWERYYILEFQKVDNVVSYFCFLFTLLPLFFSLIGISSYTCYSLFCCCCVWYKWPLILIVLSLLSHLPLLVNLLIKPWFVIFLTHIILECVTLGDLVGLLIICCFSSTNLLKFSRHLMLMKCIFNAFALYYCFILSFIWNILQVEGDAFSLCLFSLDIIWFFFFF